MSEWKEYKLGEITTDIGDGLHGPPYYTEDGDYYFINGNNISKGKIIIKGDTKRVSQTEFEKYKKPLTDKTILLSINGTIGNVGVYNNEKCILGKSACYLNLKDTVDKYFVYYIFTTDDFQSHLLNIATGTTIQNVPLKGLRESTILLPSLDEQECIASILCSLDDKIDLLNRENATLEALAETLFRHYFIENPNPDWKEGKLGDVAKIGIGRTPPRKETTWFSSSPKDVKWISIKDMGEQGAFIFNTSEKLTKEAVETFKIPIIPPNTVVLSFKMTVGRIGITTETMLSNEAIAHFLLDDYSPITKEYLYLYLKSYKFDTLGSTSSIVTSINSAMIKDIEMTIPDKETMNIFKAQVMPLFEKIKSNQQQMQTLAIQRDTLLPRLMSGEVKVVG